MSSRDNSGLMEKLRQGLIAGDAERVKKLTTVLLHRGMSSIDLFEECLLPSVHLLGHAFARGEGFVSDLVMGSKGFEAALATLDDFILHETQPRGHPLGTVVLGTVKGDLHDLGKSCVAAVLKLANFRVVDIGRDVPAQAFVENALREGAGRVVIGLSCSITTCLPSIGHVVKEIHASGRADRLKTIVGGSVVHPYLADELGADSYGRDHIEALVNIQRLYGIHPTKALSQIEQRVRNIYRLYEDHAPPTELVQVVYTVNSQLIEYLKNHPKFLYTLRPRQFEELVAEILASFGWEVQLTPPVRDGGYDIYAISKDLESGIRSSWVIECKKYSPKKKVGVRIVRALYGVKHFIPADYALLATTSSFTRYAKEFKASCYDIELKDYHNMVEWINLYRPNPNGKLYIKDNKLIVPKRIIQPIL